MGDAHDADEKDLRLVTVANAPADEVGMKTATEVILDHFLNLGKCRGMSRVLDCVQNGRPVTVRQVEFTWCAWSNVMSDNATDFVAEGLNGD